MKRLGHIVLGTALILLSGCSAESLGLSRNPPDEFAVVERPPLSIPPEFDLLPPQPGAARPQEVSTAAQARESLLGKKAPASPVAASEAETELLLKAQADQAQADIRQKLDREADEKVSGDRHLVEDLLWWRDPATAQAVTVDAAAEQKRIEEAKAKGESVSTGATPVIEKGRSGWLGL